MAFNARPPELQHTCGMLVNTVLMGFEADEEETLERIQNRWVRDVLPHARDPYHEVVRIVEGECNVLVACNLGMDLGDALNLETNRPEGETGAISGWNQGRVWNHKFDLFFHVFDAPYGGWIVDIESGIGKWVNIVDRLNHMVRVLACRTYSTVPRLLPGEEASVLEWSAGPIASLPSSCIHELVEAQAGRTPDALALVCGRGTMTYAELSRRAVVLGAFLQGIGVCPDVLVGLLVDRGIKLVVGMLGILVAGGAYVPIDPSYPTARIRYAVEDSGMSNLVTQRVHRLSRSDVCLDEFEFGVEEDRVLIRGVRPSHLAYMIYTSGSTGRPKGVKVEHRGALSRIQWLIRASEVTSADRILQWTTFCFDVSVTEIFAALTTGALSVGVLDPASPPVHEATIVGFVPSMFMTLDPKDLAHTRWAWVAGEALGVVPDGMDHRLLNNYGPTEASIYSTSRECYAGERYPPIGKPIELTAVYVCGGGATLTTTGVSGELCIGGVGVARGYHNRPELTCTKFIPSPWMSGPESGVVRLYKTGDLVRWNADAELEFVGRIDHQVKVRGFRIELGEVEAAIQRFEGVEMVVCTLRAVRQIDFEMIYEDQYKETEVGAHSIWYDSRTMKPYSTSAMNEWRNNTVQRLLRYCKVRRVLEIGCGTGIIMVPLLAQASLESFVGTDISKNVVKMLKSRVHDRRVAFHAMNSVAIAKLPKNFDTVIINSVIQYFRDERVLFETLRLAVERIDGAGTIFIGDVREKNLKRFHSKVESFEKELVVDAAYFFALPRRLPRISNVAVLLKRGTQDTEMNAYRVDVVLDIGPIERNGCLHSETHLNGWLDTNGSKPCDVLSSMTEEPVFCLADPSRFGVTSVTLPCNRGEGRPSISHCNVPELDIGSTLVAYVQSSANLDASKMKTTLSTTLPEHMVPSHIVVMVSLPLTSNGKVDRNALPDIELADTQSYVAPRTTTEVSLCSAWADALGVERVGIHDDFFTLGGHSLLAMRLARATGHSAAQIMANPSVGALSLIPPEKYALRRTTSMRATDAERRLLYLQLNEPESIAYNLPFEWTFEVGVDVMRNLEKAIVVTPVLSVCYTQDGLATPGVPPKIVHGAPADMYSNFDLERGPVARFGVEGQRLTACVHHTVFDLRSVALFLHRVENPDRVQCDTHTMRDYAEWEADRVVSAEYWRAALPTSPRFPPPVTSGPRIWSAELRVEKSAVSRVREVCGTRGTSTFAFVSLIASFHLILHVF